MWYIQKAHNAKLFSNIKWSPVDIVNTARSESEASHLANSSEETAAIVLVIVTAHDMSTSTFKCFVDGSWKVDDQTSGIRCVLELQDDTTDLLGLNGVC